jgi:MFS family permease
MSDAFQGDVLAEETHSGRAWSLIILLALIGPLIAVALAPVAAVRWPVLLAGLAGLVALAMAWSGFQYRFLRHGVEIRTLGFRLRSIPKESIVSYSIEPWTFIRGYGIRGMGSRRAYVWGNKVAHIKTSKGEVFLGHSDPERIVRDLDLVTGFVTRG